VAECLLPNGSVTSLETKPSELPEGTSRSELGEEDAGESGDQTTEAISTIARGLTNQRA
jgi:hypothetical protein